MERFAYHNLEKIDFYPRSEPKEADKIVVKMWASRGEICGYGLKPLVQAPARGRGLSIEVRPENFAVLATAKTMYVYAANFVERKKVREKETEDETPYINCMPFANSALRCESSRRFNFTRFFAAMAVPVVGRSVAVMGVLMAMPREQSAGRRGCPDLPDFFNNLRHVPGTKKTHSKNYPFEQIFMHPT